MIKLQRHDGSWIDFHCPEWPYYTATQQQEILEKLRSEPRNIILMKGGELIASKCESRTNKAIPTSISES